MRIGATERRYAVASRKASLRMHSQTLQNSRPRSSPSRLLRTSMPPSAASRLILAKRTREAWGLDRAFKFEYALGEVHESMSWYKGAKAGAWRGNSRGSPQPPRRDTPAVARDHPPRARQDNEITCEVLSPRSPQSAVNRRSSIVVGHEAAKSSVLNPRRSSILGPIARKSCWVKLTPYWWFQSIMKSCFAQGEPRSRVCKRSVR